MPVRVEGWQVEVHLDVITFAPRLYRCTLIGFVALASEPERIREISFVGEAPSFSDAFERAVTSMVHQVVGRDVWLKTSMVSEPPTTSPTRED